MLTVFVDVGEALVEIVDAVILVFDVTLDLVLTLVRKGLVASSECRRGLRRPVSPGAIGK